MKDLELTLKYIEQRLENARKDLEMFSIMKQELEAVCKKVNEGQTKGKFAAMLLQGGKSPKANSEEGMKTL